MYFAFSLLTVTIVVCCLLFVTLLYIPLLWLLWFTEVHWQASVMSGWQVPRWSQLVQQELFPLQVLIAKLFFEASFSCFLCANPSQVLKTLCFQNIWLSVRHTTNTTSCLHHLWSVLITPLFFEASCSSNSVHICTPKLLKILWFWKFIQSESTQTASCSGPAAPAPPVPGFHCPRFILKSPPQVTVCTSAWSLAPGSCSGQVVFQCIAWLSTPAIVSTVLDWQIWARLYCST